MPRLTFFDWVEAKIDAIRATTPADGETGPAPLTPKEHVRRALGMDVAEASGDVRPTLVYFHWPHEDPVNGKTSDTLCQKVLNDEAVARWGLLYRCVQVDMASSDPKLTALLGAGDKPSLVAVTKDAEVVARVAALGSSTKMQKALEAALQKFPEASKKLKADLSAQEKDLAQAKLLVKADKPSEAKPLLDKVRYSNLRVGEAFDVAMRIGMDVDAWVEREAKK